ncbi:MAG: class I mannose-6-phosphate isomerase [Candidatus Izemoplasmatales bacterium]|nr:class I mannose-6-phosphate isomerase [Candidatus Izemoplasmatales bacterium]
MAYLNFSSEYDKHPVIEIRGYDHDAFPDDLAIVSELKKIRSGVIAFEVYPGCDTVKLRETILNPLHADLIINIEDYLKPKTILNQLLEPFITEDRVFGMMCPFQVADFYDQDRLKAVKAQVSSTQGKVIVYGFGAIQIPFDQLIYLDITRWEIQLRFRQGMPNITADNSSEDSLRKFKRGYFVEWRVADRIKCEHYLNSRYLIDASHPENYTMITGRSYLAGMEEIVRRPFRLIPYFDPGVWGGKWMEEVCSLPKAENNYAWAFDGVPEENALCFRYNEVDFHFPAMNVVCLRPLELLGKKVVDRFGAEYPIRFDFLDTMGGGNLSLQVHPLPDYIKKTFGMKYTQDESYYILDASADSCVYLGLKDNVIPSEFIRDLENANRGLGDFPDEKYINKFPARKHDHFLIPAGTIHCSGKNTMVLEISSTPYIFTFKLWDWGRLGLDGLPRPVHIHHGKHVIQYDRTTEWVEENLINRIERLSPHEERTGLHELEFIDTHRFTFSDPITINTHGSFNQCNLVSGRAAIITDPLGTFQPFEVHYAETFIIPELIRQFRIEPKYSRDECMLIQAYVR